MPHALACAAFESGGDRQVGQHHGETDAVDPGKFADLDQRQDTPLAAACEVPGQTGEDPGAEPFQIGSPFFKPPSVLPLEFIVRSEYPLKPEAG